MFCPHRNLNVIPQAKGTSRPLRDRFEGTTQSYCPTASLFSIFPIGVGPGKTRSGAEVREAVKSVDILGFFYIKERWGLLEKMLFF